jgi:hypothetical protein
VPEADDLDGLSSAELHDLAMRLTLRAHVDDITDSGRGEIAELLRPFYRDSGPLAWAMTTR